MEEAISVEILERYIKGNCTPDEVEQVKAWYRSFERNDDYVSGISLAEEKALEEKLYNHILQTIGVDTGLEENDDTEADQLPRRSIFSRWYTIAGAAAVLLIAGATYIFTTHHTPFGANETAANVSTKQIQSITNNSDQVYKAILPDHSIVWLKPNSQLTYPEVFDTKSRMVTISGEGFFEVTKNPNCPFIINSPSIITKVWGTSFLVRDNNRNSPAEVSVMTGKVSVSLKTTDNGPQPSLKLEQGEVMLYPHQKVVYLTDQKPLMPQTEGVADENAMQIWKHVNLSFDNKPIREIVPVLNSKFHVHIVVKNDRLNRYILNADMTGLNLPDVLEALKKSLNINYEISDDGIELQ
ncbi:FecR family protein [Mucilaginibacter sp.]|uniref:FecR family protein n=1 Tax=Mucilaginibacter sp. TaxID=1882438 RepID=UPI00284DD1E3|nr:FecR family protein [Mucilaginibacter sp.]MDR3696096.1 FecR family protein [Mucilaginibacter sp.]